MGWLCLASKVRAKRAPWRAERAPCAPASPDEPRRVGEQTSVRAKRVPFVGVNCAVSHQGGA